MHECFMGDTHCCACLASVEHAEFDASGCEFCDLTIAVEFDGTTFVLTSKCDPTPELRFTIPTTTTKES